MPGDPAIDNAKTFSELYNLWKRHIYGEGAEPRDETGRQGGSGLKSLDPNKVLPGTAGEIQTQKGPFGYVTLRDLVSLIVFYTGYVNEAFNSYDE